MIEQGVIKINWIFPVHDAEAGKLPPIQTAIQLLRSWKAGKLELTTSILDHLRLKNETILLLSDFISHHIQLL